MTDEDPVRANRRLWDARTPIHVAARQNLSRSPTANVLLVPSVMCLMAISLLPKKIPVLLQRG